MSVPQKLQNLLNRITELLVSGKTASEVIGQVLESARLATDANCLALVSAGADKSHIRSWSSKSEGSSALATQCVDAGADACLNPNRMLADTNLFVYSFEYHEGLRAAIVSDKRDDDHIISHIAGYMSLILTSEHLSNALVTAKEETKKRISEVTAVYEIGQAINELNIERLLPMITARAAAVMDAQACSLVLRDVETDELKIEASWGLAEDVVRGTRIQFGQGIAGRVAETGEPMLLVDVSADPRFPGGSVKPREGIAASICAPLKDESGWVMGVLNIRRHIPSPAFTEEDLKLFCIFASQVALAISNAKLYSSLNRRISEMSRVSDLLHAINSTLNLDYVLNQIADNIVNVVGFDRCCVYLLDPRSGGYVAGIRREYELGELPERIAPGEGVIGLAAKECIPIFERHTNHSGDMPQKETDVLATPVVVRDQCIGVVVVDNGITGRSIQTSDVSLLSTFVSQAGIAVENARLYEAMEAKYAELNVLFEHSRTISSAYGLQNIASMSVDVVRKAVECDGCLLLMMNEKRDAVTMQTSSGIPAQFTDVIPELSTTPKAVEFLRGMHSPVLVTKNDFSDFSEPVAEVFSKVIGQHGSMLFVPLLAEDATVGAYVLARSELPAFATSELKLLSIIASQAAVVLKNAIRYEQRMHRQVLDLSALYEFSHRISSSSSLEEALDAILGIVSEFVDCDEAVIYAIDHNRAMLVPTATKYSRGAGGRLPEQALDGRSVMSWTVAEGKALVLPDIGADHRFDVDAIGERGVRSLMSIPLMVQDEVVGVLCVHSACPNLYSEDEVRILSIIASQSAAIYKELEALAALTSYTDNVLTSIAAGVVTLDRGGVVLTWNRAAETMVGVDGMKAVGLHYKDLIDRLKIMDEDKKSVINIIEKVLATGRVYQAYKLAFHTHKGDVMYLNISASILSNHVGEPLGLVMIFEDITKEIKMENDFRRMGELAAIGQLAASIAHELRNPLSSIKGAAQFLQKEYETESSISEFLGIIIEEVNGLSKLTTEFLDFAKPMQLDIASVDVSEVVLKTLQLMSVHVNDNGVTITERLSRSLPKIQADGKQLEQVLKNLILNSVQAMSEGGSLTITTRPVGNHMVELVVSDTGIGIQDDKLARIFVPFFTTKTKGTGLGLSVVQKIIENHGGSIDVSSVVGKGTTFKISLPIEGAVRIMPPEAETTDRRR